MVQTGIAIQPVHPLLIHGPIPHCQHRALWIHLYHGCRLHRTVLGRRLSHPIQDTSAKHLVLPGTCPFTGHRIQYPQGFGNSSQRGRRRGNHSQEIELSLTFPLSFLM